MTATAGALDGLLEEIQAHSGLVFPESRRDEVQEVILGAMKKARIRDPEQYRDLLRREEPLLEELVAQLTIGETYFFRDLGQVEVLRRTVIPEIAGRVRGEIRVWSAGCASGEEAYTLAILFREQGLERRVKIVGTDIAADRLARARRGRYLRWSLRGVPDPIIRRHFTPVGREFVLDPAVREMVEFRYLNLAENAYPSAHSGIWGMDLILCRNVLIYFSRPVVESVARKLLCTLRGSGWLMLGASDPSIGRTLDVEVVVTEAGLLYRPADEPAAPAPEALPDIAPAAPPRVAPPAPVAAGEAEPRPEPRRTEDLSAEHRPSRPPMEEISAAYEQRQYGRAGELAEAALAQGLDTPELWILWARALANLGRLEEAGRTVARGLERHRGSAELLYLHAVLLSEAGRLEDAVAAGKQAIYLDRRLIVAHLLLGSLHRARGDLASARRSLRNARDLLEPLEGDTVVPGSDGETARALSTRTAAHLRLLEHAAGEVLA